MAYDRYDSRRGQYRDNRPRDDRYYDRVNRDDRGMFDRAGDEVRSWFGDDEAEARRDRDERYNRARYGRHDNDRYAGRDGDYDRKDRAYGYDRDRDDDYRRGLGRDDVRELDDDDATNYAQPGRVSRMAYGDDGDEDRYASSRPYRRGQYSGGRGGRQRYGRATYGGSNPGQDNFATSGEDSHYRSWRDEQISRLDRDYDEYNRERREQFHSDFNDWRSRRQEQRGHLRRARSGMEVWGSDNQRLGTVDTVRGDRIWLLDDDHSDGHRHSIPVKWLHTVDDKVTIDRSSTDARNSWRQEDERYGYTGANNEEDVRYRSGLSTAGRATNEAQTVDND